MSSRLVVMTFDNESDASTLLGDLRQVAHVGQLHLTDTAIVRKDLDGKVHVDNEMSTGTEVGAIAGSVFGSLLLLMFPVAGMVGGAALGGWLGSKIDHGVDGKFVNDVRDSMKPGGSALFLMASSGDPEAVLAVMRRYRGEVYQTTLKPEVEQALRDALHGPEGTAG